MMTQDQSRRIEQAVQAAETTTSAEIAVCVRRASGDDRFLAAIIGAIVFIAIDTIGPAIWWPALRGRDYGSNGERTAGRHRAREGADPH